MRKTSSRPKEGEVSENGSEGKLSSGMDHGKIFSSISTLYKTMMAEKKATPKAWFVSPRRTILLGILRSSLKYRSEDLCFFQSLAVNTVLLNFLDDSLSASNCLEHLRTPFTTLFKTEGKLVIARPQALGDFRKRGTVKASETIADKLKTRAISNFSLYICFIILLNECFFLQFYMEHTNLMNPV